MLSGTVADEAQKRQAALKGYRGRLCPEERDLHLKGGRRKKGLRRKEGRRCTQSPSYVWEKESYQSEVTWQLAKVLFRCNTLPCIL